MSKPDPKAAEFFRDLRAGLKTGSIFAPRVCTKAAPDMGARRHEGVEKIAVVEQPSGVHVRYWCRDCGAIWEAAQ